MNKSNEHFGNRVRTIANSFKPEQSITKAIDANDFKEVSKQFEIYTPEGLTQFIKGIDAKMISKSSEDKVLIEQSVTSLIKGLFPLDIVESGTISRVYVRLKK